MKRITCFCLLAVLSFVLPLTAPAEDKPAQENRFVATVDKDGVQRVEIVGGGYFFRPNHIVVKVNVPVELKVRKESGVVPHNVVMKAPEAGMAFEESLDSEPKAIGFTPTRTGMYPFYCGKRLWPFDSHREKGMEGSLEVVE